MKIKDISIYQQMTCNTKIALFLNTKCVFISKMLIVMEVTTSEFV